jgi:TrmH family RNA methyltransferase
MLSKSIIKYIRSLGTSKNRLQYKSFVVEGDTIAEEWLASNHEIEYVLALDEWILKNKEYINKHPEAKVISVNENELQALSSLKTANKVILSAKMAGDPDKAIAFKQQWYIALDDIRDPGNMGTIIRIADWFGIEQLICSDNCVDCYNPKVVQAAMGSHLRVKITYGNLNQLLSQSGLPIYATCLQGQDIYGLSNIQKGIIVIGNESLGISSDVLALADKKIRIPAKGGAESLNAAVSAGIVCALLIR